MYWCCRVVVVHYNVCFECWFVACLFVCFVCFCLVFDGPFCVSCFGVVVFLGEIVSLVCCLMHCCLLSSSCCVLYCHRVYVVFFCVCLVVCVVCSCMLGVVLYDLLCV